jgi:opacity protein-like surface antigen
MLSFKVEYLYVNLGGGNAVNTVALDAGGARPSSFYTNFGRVDFSTVRVGVNLRFGEPAVVARY